MESAFQAGQVQFDIEVAQPRGRAVTFTVEGGCNHFVVEVASTEQRLAGKAAKAGRS